jgi:hypothetical protein
MTEAGPGTHIVYDDEYADVPPGSVGRPGPRVTVSLPGGASPGSLFWGRPPGPLPGAAPGPRRGSAVRGTGPAPLSGRGGSLHEGSQRPHSGVRNQVAPRAGPTVP